MSCNKQHQPLYRNLSLPNIRAQAEQATRVLRNCALCPRRCGVNRAAGESGECGAADQMLVAGYGLHFGEERELVGYQGSGTIFFACCNLACIYCQNFSISRGMEGEITSPEKLSRIMLSLQKQGCHNINLVTPTPYLPQILSALAVAIEKGLHVPIVYNCGGYEDPQVLKLLEGIIDIYMPDFKYSNPEAGLRYSGVKEYPSWIKKTLQEMQRQVGDLQTDSRGIAFRGLLVRHLILPEGLAGTGKVVRFLAEEISLHGAINIMKQYYPAYKAHEYPPLNRHLHPQEYREAVDLAKKAGLRVLD